MISNITSSGSGLATSLYALRTNFQEYYGYELKPENQFYPDLGGMHSHRLAHFHSHIHTCCDIHCAPIRQLDCYPSIDHISLALFACCSGKLLWCYAILLFGFFIAVPLRKLLIDEYELPFPSGFATAYVIKAMHATKGNSKVSLMRLPLAAMRYVHMC